MRLSLLTVKVTHTVTLPIEQENVRLTSAKSLPYSKEVGAEGLAGIRRSKLQDLLDT